MRKSIIPLLVCALLILVSGCKKKEQTTIIITEKPTTEKPMPTQEIGDYEETTQTAWIGKEYSIYVHRYADHDLPVVKDGEQTYYDNRIEIKVSRQDGSVFFTKTFSKTDFNSFLDDNFRKNGALLGVVFDKAEGDNLCFVASVGSPDKLSDDFIPMTVKLSRMGSLDIKRSKNLDTPSDDNLAQDEDEGI